MKRFRAAALMLLSVSLAHAVLAQEAQKPAEKAAQSPAQAKQDSAPAASESAKPADNAGKQTQEASAPAASQKPAGDAKATPQRFVPSEQVRSDFDVSFPVDI
jgi:cytoskeletal protein RodZ